MSSIGCTQDDIAAWSNIRLYDVTSRVCRAQGYLGMVSYWILIGLALPADAGRILLNAPAVGLYSLVVVSKQSPASCSSCRYSPWNRFDMGEQPISDILLVLRLCWAHA